VSGFEDVFQFWAPNKSDVPVILHELEQWSSRLPKTTHTEVSPFLGIDSPLPKFPCC
jgi:hypothetical protein